MFEDMRYDIVTVLVFSQIEDSFEYLYKEWSDLLLLTVFEHSLDYATAELMHRKLIHAADHDIDYELYLFAL